MEDRQVDNRIITKTQKINQIDNKLIIEKKKLQKLDSIEVEIANLNQTVSKLVELLSKSIEGKNIYLEDMQNSTKNLCQKANYNVENAIFATKKNINKLYKEKDILIKDNKKE